MMLYAGMDIKEKLEVYASFVIIYNRRTDRMRGNI